MRLCVARAQPARRYTQPQARRLSKVLVYAFEFRLILLTWPETRKIIRVASGFGYSEESWTRCHKYLAPSERKHLRVLHGAHELRQCFLRVAIKHSRHRLEEERILESRKTFALPAFQHDD